MNNLTSDSDENYINYRYKSNFYDHRISIENIKSESQLDMFCDVVLDDHKEKFGNIEDEKLFKKIILKTTLLHIYDHSGYERAFHLMNFSREQVIKKAEELGLKIVPEPNEFVSPELQMKMEFNLEAVRNQMVEDSLEL